MRKFYIIGLIAVAALIVGIAIADEIKFSTYYPAPFGQYREFSTTGKTTLATDEWGIEGVNAMVGIGTTDPNQQLEITESFRLPVTIDSNTGVIYKAGDRFIHDYKASGSSGHNTFVGVKAGNFTMTATLVNHASYNTAVGNGVLRYNTTGYNNSAIGYEALYKNTEGCDNSAIGRRALYSNITGHSNSAIGRRTLYSNTTGYFNSAIGIQSLYRNTAGHSNSAIGRRAGYSITTGNYNTFLGYNAGYNDLQKVDALNSIALGKGTYTTANNQVVIGNSSVTETLLRGNVGIGTVSPGAKLEIYEPVNPSILIVNAQTYPAEAGSIVFASNSGAEGNTDTRARIVHDESANGLRFDVRTSKAVSWIQSMFLQRSSGNVGINETDPSARLYVDGNIKYTGSCVKADYVFAPEYKLESIEDHAKSMWKEKHLPGIVKPEKTEEGKDIIELGEDRRGLLEELEKAHIYIEQLNQRMKSLEAKLAE